MFFPKDGPLLVNRSENSGSDVDFLLVPRGHDFVGCEPSDVPSVSFADSLGVHHFVHSDALKTVALPQNVWERAKKNAHVIFHRSANPRLQAHSVLLTGGFLLILRFFTSCVDLLDFLESAFGATWLSSFFSGCSA